ncbi:GntP family permease [Caulobacter radicis]|uniref:Transporter n=1 Tax=Caulobacter radicis TaxID=2172650 RepID=A0A2T9J7E3_9CAUL|nr:GntP family permease [Caulobacter radicis]PVM77474.1 transporter [Caulobacter radicis]
MSLLICLGALAALIYLAYRGFSVILVAPLAAMAAVLLTDPSAVAPAFSGLFMDKLGAFVKLYFPVFLLGALFGKLIEVSGAARAIVGAISRRIGPNHAILAITVVGMLLTYGGVSVFVVVFATYPFAVEMFRQADIPKRLIPATIAFSAFTITMDALPGTPQIQNIIPTTFFGTTAYAAPVLSLISATFTFGLCFAYLRWQQQRAAARGEGYGSGHRNEPERLDGGPTPGIWLALVPLLLVALGNRLFLALLQTGYGDTAIAALNPTVANAVAIAQNVKANAALWALEGALLLGIASTAVIGWRTIRARFAEASQAAIGGSLLASLNTASEYGFGAVIAALPGFHQIASALSTIRDPLLNVAITTNILCGVTGSASGGLSLTLGAFADRFIAAANASGIPGEVMHRVAALASGGMDTLPHNGAIITLLAVTGLTHRQAYKDIFVLTVIKTLTAFFAIAIYYSTGLV